MRSSVNLIMVFVIAAYTAALTLLSHADHADDDGRIAVSSALFVPQPSALTATNRTMHPPSSDVSLPRWKGTTCLEHQISHIDNSKIRSKCAHVNSTISRTYCERIRRGPQPVCGHWSKGRFENPISDEQINHRVTYAHTGAPCRRRDLNIPLTAQIRDELFYHANEEQSFFQLMRRDCILPEMNRGSLLQTLRSAAGFSSSSPNRDTAAASALFTGDSMMRQLWLRLVAVLRDEDVFSEHYFHFDGLYVITRNGDQMVPLRDNAAIDPLSALVLRKHFPGARWLSSQQKVDAGLAEGGPQPDDEILFASLYQWDPEPKRFRKDFIAIRPRLHLSSFMYWWKGSAADEFQEYTKSVDKLHDEFQQQSNKYHFIYVTTPWTRPGVFGGVGEATRRLRNDLAWAWIRQNDDYNKTNQVTRHLLDFEGLAEVRRWPKTSDEIHYGCIWTPQLSKRIRGQKENGQDCRDPMNRALLHWVFALLQTA